MKFVIEPYELEIFELLKKTAAKLGYPTYVIGGYVRDRILGRSTKDKDIDIVCVGSGIKFAETLASFLKPSPKVVSYARFGTAAITYKGWSLEFVGARKESYNPDSRKPVVEDGSLEDDQNRRDFTINALAVCMNEENFGELVDPFNGIQDMEDKILRTPLDPHITFSDDPLRMMRAIRFATQLGFFIEPKTLNAIKDQKERISIISQERISTELNKILAAPKPSVGLAQLFETGLLEIIFPELQAMQGIEEKNGVAHKDNFWHTLQVVDNMAGLSDNLWLRWSALLHDIGKPTTKRFFSGQGWTFHSHEVVGAKMTVKIFQRMKLPLDNKLKFVQKIVELHQRPILLTKDRSEITDSALRRLLFDAGEELDDLLIMCEADTTTANQKKKAIYMENLAYLRVRLDEVEQKDHLRLWQPPISGEEIMEIFAIKPSREVGLIKNAIRDAILDGVIGNNREDAYHFMLKTAEKLGLKEVKSLKD
jgi:tRNA nucleotidyltransferase (CCA-adding enzyme)